MTKLLCCVHSCLILPKEHNTLDASQQYTPLIYSCTAARQVTKTHHCGYTLDLFITRWLKPNSITLAGSELAPNMFGVSSELASVMEFGREPASLC